MATTKIRGNTQIMDDTITNAQIKSDAAISLSKLAEAVIQADGGQAFTADQSMGGFKLTNLADGVNPGDGVNKSQLDAVAAAAAAGGAHQAVRAATTGNVSLSGTQTIDGVSLIAGDRVFVKNQTAPAENGIYSVAAGAWARTADADTWDELVMTPLVPVEEGTTNADTLWLITADRGGTLGTTAVTSIQLPGPSDILAGAGLARSGQTINFATADTSLTVNADDAQVNINSLGGLEVSSGVRVKLNGATLDRSASGMKVADQGIGPTQLGAVAGTGLSGGNGSAISVDYTKHVKRETPTGSINGSNVTFTLANTPVSGTEEVFLNGILQDAGAGNDYTISGGTITMLSAPVAGDKIRVNYIF